MFSHPILLTVAGLTYISIAFFVLQLLGARMGYEDETGFHFSEPLEDVVVPADEVRPAWFTGALAERFASQRIEISAGAAS